jgi:molybdopterin synthase sulfur carrier subunit
VTTVRIPPVLREAAGGNKQVDLEGGTVGEILAQLVDRFPGLRDQLYNAGGDLNRFVNVYLNSEDVRYLSELATPAGPRDTIVVLPAMAGGAPWQSSPQSSLRGRAR